jgi:hypothetical protein
MGLDFHAGVLILGLLLLAVAYVAYRGTTPTLSPGLRWFLFSLRACAFVLLAFLLMDPRYILHSSKSESPQVMVLVDRSTSMSLPAVGWDEGPDRFTRAQDIAGELQRVIRSHGGRSGEVYFSAGPSPGTGDTLAADGQGTEIRRSLASLHKKHEGENIVAFVVLSDGVETEERLVRQPLPDVPVFTVGLGDTSAPEDVRIKDVDYNSIVRAPARSAIRATLHYSGGNAKRVHLRLRESGRTVFEKDTLMTPQARELVQEIAVDFPEAGRRQFLLEADVDGYDAEAENNRRDIVIEAEKAGVRILIVDLLPEWELHFLTDFLRNDQTFDFNLVASVGDHASLRRGKIKRPEDFVSELDDYDALVLVSVDERFIDDRVAAAITRFVRERGKGLLVMPGSSSLFENSAAWNRLAKLLPVTSRPPHRFNLQFTSVHPGAQAATNPITSQLVPLLGQTDWQQRSPLLGYYTALVPKNGVEVLLETDQGRSPAFVYRSEGKGRVALLSAGPLWRWKFLGEGMTLYDEMVSRLLDVLSRGEDTERFLLLSRKNVYDSGEAPVITAEIFNEKMQPVTGVPVKVEVTRIEENGSEVPLSIVSMHRDAVDDTRFRAALQPLAPGRYRISGEAEFESRKLRSPAVEIAVSEVSVEFQRVTQDRTNLAGIAGGTGGAYYAPEDVGEMAARIPLEPRLVEITSENSLRTSLLVFSLVLVLLGFEWVVRKRAGMV